MRVGWAVCRLDFRGGSLTARALRLASTALAKRGVPDEAEVMTVAGLAEPRGCLPSSRGTTCTADTQEAWPSAGGTP
ncbi:hypothetical protein SGPA1_40423 [Streptomyces misionensis JCM 4497]